MKWKVPPKIKIYEALGCIGDKRIDTYCRNENVPILLKIPEKRKIAQLYSKGIALVSESFEWHEMFGQVFTQIQNEVRK